MNVGLKPPIPVLNKLWPLPGPSLCYLPELHGLPDPAGHSLSRNPIILFLAVLTTRANLPVLLSSVLEQFLRLIPMQFFSSEAIPFMIQLFDVVSLSVLRYGYCSPPTSTFALCPFFG